jgi:hypothetical protein
MVGSYACGHDASCSSQRLPEFRLIEGNKNLTLHRKRPGAQPGPAAAPRECHYRAMTQAKQGPARGKDYALQLANRSSSL